MARSQRWPGTRAASACPRTRSVQPRPLARPARCVDGGRHFAGRAPGVRSPRRRGVGRPRRVGAPGGRPPRCPTLSRGTVPRSTPGSAGRTWPLRRGWGCSTRLRRRTPRSASPGWLGAAGGDRGNALTWPPLSGPAPASGVAAGFVGLGPGCGGPGDGRGPRARRDTSGPPSGPPKAGRPGETLAAVPLRSSMEPRSSRAPPSSPVSAPAPRSHRSGWHALHSRRSRRAWRSRLGRLEGWPGRARQQPPPAAGVADLEATLDGAPASVVAGHVSVATEGDHLVQVRVTDRVGRLTCAWTKTAPVPRGRRHASRSRPGPCPSSCGMWPAAWGRWRSR